MKIIDKRVHEKVQLGDLNIGDTFLYDGVLYMKINNNVHPNLMLINGISVSGIHDDTLVDKVDVEIHIIN